MDNPANMLVIPHDLYERIAEYATSHGATPEDVAAEWLRERLSEANAPQKDAPPEIQARLAALAGLEGIFSVPVEREWADQHDLYVAGAPGESDQPDDHSA